MESSKDIPLHSENSLFTHYKLSCLICYLLNEISNQNELLFYKDKRTHLKKSIISIGKIAKLNSILKL